MSDNSYNLYFITKTSTSEFEAKVCEKRVADIIKLEKFNQKLIIRK